jgi:hypothetical protein
LLLLQVFSGVNKGNFTLFATNKSKGRDFCDLNIAQTVPGDCQTSKTMG